MTTNESLDDYLLDNLIDKFKKLVDERNYRKALNLYQNFSENQKDILKQNQEFEWIYRVALKASRLQGI
ncbi:MAG: hypothetical protein QXW97_04290 [Candidatus Pacearchaeota archaeon]